MADSPPEKSRGMKFAEQQLARYGWAEGKGLGRDEDGISEAIRVKVKCNKEGIGHKKAEEFTFHWWDHVFNKASSSLQVESGQNGVEVKTTVETEGSVSNKKPRKAALAKDKMYGCFVKAGTLLSGEAQPEPQSSDSSSSSSSEDDDRMDLSSMTRLSDADLMKACGGRTAHKGARHGFGMSAKLARLEQQEAEYMAKYGKKNQLPNNRQENSPPVDQSTAKSQEDLSEVPQKKKKRNTKGDLDKDDSPPQEEISEVPQKKKKNKKNKKGDLEKDDSPPQEEISEVPQKKKKNKKGDLEKDDSSPQEEISEVPQKKKKNKKNKKADLEEEEDSPPQEERRRKRGEEELELMEAAVKTPECSLEEPPVKKKKRKSCREEKETEEECPPKPKTKKKRRKEEEEETNMDEEERSVEEEQTKEAPLRKKRSKESRE